jgi:hypothetical protein
VFVGEDFWDFQLRELLGESFSPDPAEGSADRNFDPKLARSEKEGVNGVRRGDDDNKASGIPSWPPVFIFILSGMRSSNW